MDGWTTALFDSTVPDMRTYALLAILVLTPASLAAEPQAQPRPTTAQEAPKEGTLIAYVDDKGQLHVVNSMEMVPLQYRDRARPAQLGESSTLSSGKRPRSQRQSRSNSQAPRRAAAAGKAADSKQAGSRARGKSKRTKKENGKRLAELKKRRAAVLDELALLEEGWLPPDGDKQSVAERPEPSRKELEHREGELGKQLQALDKEIAQLEAKK